MMAGISSPSCGNTTPPAKAAQSPERVTFPPASASDPETPAKEKQHQKILVLEEENCVDYLMGYVLRVPAVVAVILIISPSRMEAETVRTPPAPQTATKQPAAAPTPDLKPPAPPAVPPATTRQPGTAAPEEKNGAQRAGKGDDTETKPQDAGDGNVVDDPRLDAILLNADANGDGQLSGQEFRQMPLMKGLKKERIDSLFTGLDADFNAALTSQELTKGSSLLAQLAKEGRSPADEKGLAGQAKELRRQLEKTAGTNPKSFLLKLIQNADKDGSGGLSVDEFRQLPLLNDLKQERVDSLFGDIDTNADGSLSPEEIGNGFGSITSLAKEGKSLLDEKDAARLVKKFKSLVQ